MIFLYIIDLLQINLVPSLELAHSYPKLQLDYNATRSDDDEDSALLGCERFSSSDSPAQFGLDDRLRRDYPLFERGWVVPRLFVRQLRRRMQLRNALIASVLQAFSLAGKAKRTNRGSVQLEIVSSPLPEARAENLPTFEVNHKLAFEGVPLLLTGIELPLLSFRTFNWAFRHVHDNDFRRLKSSQQSFLPWQAQRSTLP